MRRILQAPATVALVLYLVLWGAFTGKGWTQGGSRWVGVDGDPQLFMWYLKWLPFALTHHHNPLLTNYLQYPAGANLMWNTSITFPALLLWPITSSLGPIVSYNTLSVLAPSLSGWCAFLALRRYVSFVPALAAGLVYAFSPYMVAQALGHPNLSFAVFPPLTLLILDEVIVRQRHSARLVGMLFGLLAAAQLMTGEEVLALTVLIAVIGIVVLALLNREAVRQHARHAITALITAVVVVALLVAVPLGVQFLGPQRLSGAIQVRNIYVTDISSLITPSPLQALSVNGRFAPPESGSYVGIPLLAIAVG
ncbi:MAG TPA: hypothetical protein VE219_04210, partial [Candidatus Sulfotelmatobacter sp.]|nr:hypothetical protein [Candidatus Sulfotelmatobacter sp.]